MHVTTEVIENRSDSGVAVGTGVAIGDVERDTGLSKDTLRVWERRYGFPLPERDGNGERRYAPDQVHRLRLIRRLMDAGHRPGKLMSIGLTELEALQSAPLMVDDECGRIAVELLALARRHQLSPLRAVLNQTLARQGLQRFVIETMPTVLRHVGEAWLHGEIGIADEHILTEALQNLIRSAMHALPTQSAQAPAVLLTSLPEEDHGLGLLMVQALLESEQASCLPLGLRTPLVDICSACRMATIDVVGISVSAAYAPRKAQSALKALRDMLPSSIELWVGGAGISTQAAALGDLPAVRLLADISDVLIALEDWRSSRGVV